DRGARFAAYGWHVQHVPDGNDVEGIDRAIRAAQEDPRPSLIVCRTHIGYGLPTRQDTADAHGEPPGEEELKGARLKLDWPLEPWFYIPDDVLTFYRQSVDRGAALEAEWEQRLERYSVEFPELGAELKRRLAGELPEGWDKDLPSFPADPKGMATRQSSGKVLDTLTERIPDLVGGSADLSTSNKTRFDGASDFQAESPSGRYLRFGVREHGMGTIVNGLAYHGGVIPFGGTFLVFSDYMRPAVRLSALAKLGSIWIYTHDSIGLGEDGPTHQPVEHLAALRAIPDLAVVRPADANEVVEAWRVAILRRNSPTALILSRQGIPTLDRARYAPASGLGRGAYILADLGDRPPQILLVASGAEVALIVEAGEKLAGEGVDVRLVSFPCWELFEAQDEDYRDSVFPPGLVKRLGVEAGVSQGWSKWLGDTGQMVSIETYGASAPYQKIFEEYGLTFENVYRKAIALLKG
ncbi:MAG TPA: transketolase, partial [Anaerolineales bacterium]|nr:transketolase [Anaerolineales bacterium]